MARFLLLHKLSLFDSELLPEARGLRAAERRFRSFMAHKRQTGQTSRGCFSKAVKSHKGTDLLIHSKLSIRMGPTCHLRYPKASTWWHGSVRTA